MTRRTKAVRQFRAWVRTPRSGAEWLMAAGAALLIFLTLRQLAILVIGALVGLWWLFLLVAVVAGAVWVWWRSAGRRARAARLAVLRYSLAELDAMDPTAFEYAVRDLMIRDGIDARHVGQRGDQAADAIGRDRTTGRRVVAQCKHTTVGGKVGSQVMYQIKGTAGPAHGARHAFVVTNGGLTVDARRWGLAHDVGWIDRERLRAWAQDGRPVQQLLRWPGRRRATLLPGGAGGAARLSA